MSVLDELRKKADEKKAAEQRQAMHEDLLEQVYQIQILPKMQLIFDNFKETIDYLNFLDEPIKVNNYCEKFPQFGELAHSNYKINTDGRIGLANYDRLMQVNISFLCEGKGDFSYRLESEPVIEKEVTYLQAKRLFFDWKRVASTNGVPAAQFTIQRKIPIAFRVEVDYSHSKIKVAIKNHENLQSFSKSYGADELDDKFVERLLSYFLRKNREFVKTEELSEASKEMIKASVRIAAINKKREEQLAQPEDLPFLNEEPEPEKKSTFKSLFSKFKKT